MRFESPWLWILVPMLWLGIAWLSRRSYAQLEPWARTGSTLLRCAIVLLIVGAMTRPELRISSRRHHLLLLVDCSRSVDEDNRNAALGRVHQLAGAHVRDGASNVVSVIAMGERPQLIVSSTGNWDELDADDRDLLTYPMSLPRLQAERTQSIARGADEEKREELDGRIERIEMFRDRIAGEYTDLERAMRLALNSGVVDELKTIAVLTDGNFNHGQWQRAMESAAAAEAPVHVVTLDRPPQAEVAATELILPQRVRSNETFAAEVHVASTVEAPAQLVIYKDGFLVEERAIDLVPGRNQVEVNGLYFREKGFHGVQATVRCPSDTRFENNSVRSLLTVPGEVRVLYVDGDEELMTYLKGALELEGMLVEARPAGGVPDSMSDLLSFDVFILSNVAADRLSLRQMEMIRSYVEDFGGGFMMLGGDESFGLGGYYSTPIEEVLPVKMPVRKDMLRPAMALALVIDKSGSMTGAKIQLAKRAAIATAEAINPMDQIGVIAFDGAAQVILELTAASDRGTIATHIAALDAGGGTFMQPALEAAHQRLLESNARRKHIIALSDGQTQGFGYEQFAQNLALEGITISTVGIGEGADMRLMEAIAMAGGGRAYFTNDFFNIPQIFTREALRASNSMLIERLVMPVGMDQHAAVGEIDLEELPLLNGYVATTPRAAASVPIISDSGDPILALWRYGLGRTAAFTSDAKPRWAEDWIRWPDFAKFWSQVVRSIAGESVGEDIAVEIAHERHDDAVKLRADVRDPAGNFLPDVTIDLVAFDEAGGRTNLPVAQSGPGLFEADDAQVRFGQDQQFAWQLQVPGNEPLTVPYGLVYSYSPEFHTLGMDEEVLDDIRQRRQGEVMSVDEAELPRVSRRSRRWVELWPWLLTTALLLAPLDILVRRLG